MMKSKVWCILMCVAVLLQTSCSSDNDGNSNSEGSVVEQTPGKIVMTDEQRQMAADGNDFAFNLMRELSKTKQGNMVVSPLSVGYLLGMLNDGANGITRQEIMQALGFGNSDAKAVNEFFGNLMTNAPQVDEKVKLDIANLLLANSNAGAVFDSQFCADMQGYYQAAVESMDFSQAEATANRVNSWCNEKTHGMIPRILAPEIISPSLLTILGNSVYFKAEWLKSFDAKQTSIQDFKKDDGTTAMMPIMQMNRGMDYSSDGDIMAVRLPYGRGKFAMTLMMPADESMPLDDMIAKLTGERWNHLSAMMKTHLVDLKMPRFETTTDAIMNESLKSMGVKSVFGLQADFSGMLSDKNKQFYVSLIKQVAKIEVNEEGTMAASVSIGLDVSDAGPGPAVPPVPIEYYAKRPFVYVISESDSQAIFFMGKVTGKE